jgi:hypothetical protein
MVTGKNQITEFVICVANEGYEDLDPWKVYQVLPDASADAVGCLRVIDESGEDYLYPADRFAPVHIPRTAQSRLPKWQPSHANKALPPVARGRRRLNA